jgi:hypothetical protein
MKKLVLFGLIVGSFAVLTSCNKDYNCQCTTSDSSGETETAVINTTLTGKEADVKDACETTTTVGTITTTCIIN